MKSQKAVRVSNGRFDSDDSLRKAGKLAPIKKSGKDRYNLYGGMADDEDDEQLDYKQRESILDYFDDQEDDE